MRTIEWTSQFKRDFKRELKGKYRATLEVGVSVVVDSLANDHALDSHYRDHALIGNWKDHRDCHIKPDLVLIYRYNGDNESLQLVRLGSHSELGI